MKNATSYFRDSRFFLIRHSYTAEVIRQPKMKAVREGLEKKISSDLRQVLLKACSITAGQEERKFWEYISMSKVALDVEYLIVLRQQRKILGFASGKYLQPQLFYINAAMVVPELQAGGVGALLSALLFQVARDGEARDSRSLVIFRTHNHNATSSLLKAMQDVKISTEPGLIREDQAVFDATAEYLHCEFQHGICYNVYPKGVPANKQVANPRVVKAFENLGIRDACFIKGYLNYDYVSRILRKTVQPFTESRHLGLGFGKSEPMPKNNYPGLCFNPHFLKSCCPGKQPVASWPK